MPGLTLEQVKAAIAQPAVKAATVTTVITKEDKITDEEAPAPAAKTEPVMTTTVTKSAPPPATKTVVPTVKPADAEMPATPQPSTTATTTFKVDESHAGFTGFYGGAFKTDYDKHPGKDGTEDEKGNAGIFKSNSGWQDGRYYCLYDGAQAGSIVKIADNTTGMVIYAKVLDAMPDMKQNTGIMLRICNAAAQELGVTDVKFDCTVTYYK
jgi:hypothetical protein